MDFIEALKVTLNGGRVARAGWKEESPKVYVSMKQDKAQEVLTIKKQEGTFHAWTISRDDIEADDWEEWKNSWG